MIYLRILLLFLLLIPEIAKTQGEKGKRDTAAQTSTTPENGSNIVSGGGFEFSAALMGNLPFIKDDNPAGFTQTYLRLNFQRSTDTTRMWHLFRNFFAQALFSANVENLPLQYDNSTPLPDNPVRYANKLDLIQRANVNLTMLLNLLTFRDNVNGNENWKTHVYFDAMAAYLRTEIFDSLTSSTNIAGSWLFGANLKGRFRNVSKPSRPFAVETSLQMFWVNPVNAWANYDLNFQYNNRKQATLPNNSLKTFTTGQAPYFRLGVLGIYEIGDKQPPNTDKRGNTVFVNLQYTFNYPTSPQVYHSNFFQAQVGFSINISDLLSKKTDSGNSSSEDSKPPGNQQGED